MTPTKEYLENFKETVSILGMIAGLTDFAYVDGEIYAVEEGGDEFTLIKVGILKEKEVEYN